MSVAGLTLGAPSLARGRRPRVVTVGAGVTETVFALGRGPDVVATDAASLYPLAAAGLPKLSYPKALTASALLEHRPDLLVMADEVGPKSALDGVRAAGVPIVRLPEALRLDDVAAGVRMIAEAIGEPVRGELLADALAADLALIQEGLREVSTRRRALALLGSPDADMLIAAGRGSPAAFALAFAGADNAAERINGWSWIAPAAARELDPEAVITMSGGPPCSLERMLAAPCLQNTPAARDRRVVAVDLAAFTGFGPRAAHAIHAVASGVYPEARFAPPPARRWNDIETARI